MIKAIFAMDEAGAIGYKNRLPWGHNKTDLQHFSNITRNHIVVMGRNTWDSLPENFRPLPDRHNAVVSSGNIKGVYNIPSDNLIEKITRADKMYVGNLDVFIIGGKQLLMSTLQLIETMYVTEIAGTYDYDTKLDKDVILKNMFCTATRTENDCTFKTYSRTHIENDNIPFNDTMIKSKSKPAFRSTLSLKR